MLGFLNQGFANFNPKPGQKAFIWHQIPFFPLGDIGQYQDTLSKGLLKIRNEFFDQLMGALNSLAQNGVNSAKIIEPLGDMLLLFDQMYDNQKAKDIINIDLSLESQFKSQLDGLYRHYQIPDHHRILEFSTASKMQALLSELKSLNNGLTLGQTRTSTEYENLKVLIEPLQYSAFGTFSNLGRGLFQVTLHMTNIKTGIQRNFSVSANLTEAPRLLAFQIFDYFQKQIFQDWLAVHPHLEWLPAPYRHPSRGGFSFGEALTYCKARGFRLPYARELMLAETGTHYLPGGIGPLQYMVSYPVADQRLVVTQYVYTPGLESATGGPIQSASQIMRLGQFFCVKGDPAKDVKLIQDIWALIRKYRDDQKLYQALESLRYYLGDFGVGDSVRYGPQFQSLPFLESPEEALNVLKMSGIDLSVPNGIFE